MIRRIPLTDWEPDQTLVSPGQNMRMTIGIPVSNGYVGFGSATAATVVVATSDTNIALGAKSFRSIDGSAFTFVGTPTSIKRISATSTITDVSATAYTTATAIAGGTWEFIQWEDDVIATNFADPIQRINTMSAAAFADLNSATSTPKARVLASARNFLVIGNTWDSTDGTTPYRVRWSAIGDITDWTVSAATQSDYQDLSGEGGKVQAIFGGEYCVVMQERAIYRMNYVGPPDIWQFDNVSPQIGLVAQKCAVQAGNQIFFIGQDGFYILRDGSELVPIGSGRVDDYYKNDIVRSTYNQTNVKEEAQLRTRCAVDEDAGLVYWLYASSAAFFIKSSCLVYSYKHNKWGLISAALGDDVLKYINDVRNTDVAFIKSGTDIALHAVEYAPPNNRTISLATDFVELTQNRRSMVKNVYIGSDVDWPASATSTVQISFSVQGHDTTNERATAPSTITKTISNTENTFRINARKNARFHRFSMTLKVPYITTGIGSGERGNADIKWIDVEYEPTHWR